MPVENVAVPILDSKDAPWATEKAIEIYGKTKARVHLVNVQPAYSKDISQFFNARDLARFHREDGLRVLAPVMSGLDKAEVPHWEHVLVGRKVERIVEFVTTHRCGEVVLRDRPRHLLTRLGFASVNSELRRALKALYQ